MARSLKRRITAIVISIFVASWLLSALATSLAARVVVYREIDRVLESVLLVTETVGKSMTGDFRPLQRIYEKDMVPVPGAIAIEQATHVRPALLRLQQNLHAGGLGVPSVNIWVGRIQLLVGKDTPAFPQPGAGTVQGEAVDLAVGNGTWRVMYRRSTDSNLWMAAGIENEKVQLDGTHLLRQMLMPLAVVIPLTGLALYFGIARGLLPLRRLAREIELRRTTDALYALPSDNAPLELAPVVDALNDLLKRLAETLDNEKRFTANAAHELQTPLAAISAEVQLCQRLLVEPESQRMMDRIRARVDRASHSVRQLLVLARLDPQENLATEALDISSLVREVVSELGHLAAEKQLDLTLALDGAARVQANRETLLILLRNLVNNALRYTPQRGWVHLAASPTALTIENDATPVADLRRLSDRFFRGDGASGEGAGLGLSIVKRIAELQGFTLSLQYRQREQRFSVSLTFTT